MSLFHTIVFGIVEGVTEFLPISSTAHLMITSYVLGIAQTDFVKTFEIAIQAGAILAVAVLYIKKLLQNPKLIVKIIVGCIPTGIIGLVLYKTVKTYLLGNMSIMVWALGIGGVLLIVFERWYAKKQNHSTQEIQTSEVSYPAALWMGLCQSIAIVPGVSRSAATILGGLVAGISRVTVVEFSFLLAAPTMFAATALDIYKNPQILSSGDVWTLLVGLVVSFVVAYASMKWLLKYIQTHSFEKFGWYRIIISLIILLLAFNI
jgi:undecaprenyl-diphosphatase